MAFAAAAPFFSAFARAVPYINQALHYGYTTSMILEHFSRSGNRIAKTIGLAKNSGYSDEQILKQLIDGADSAHRKAMRGSGYKRRKEIDQDWDKYVTAAKKAIGLAGLAAAGYGAYKYATRAVRPSAILPPLPPQGQGPQPQRMLPPPQRQLGGPPPRVPPQRQLTTPSPSGPTMTPPGPMITPYPASPGPSPFTQMPVNPAAGQTPGKVISAQATQPIPRPIIPPVPQDMQPESSTHPLDRLGALENVLQGMGAQPSGQIAEHPLTMMPREAKPYGMPIERGSQVFNPKTGEMGTIEDVTAKNLKINSNGKKDIIPIDDAIPMPDDDEELGQIYKKLIDKIPESEKSSVADHIGYDPNTNSVLVVFHDGKAYTYQNIPEEIAREIANSDHFAKTTGGNYMGKWYKGKPSKGSGLAALFKDLQDLAGGKGKEYSGKFVPLYSMHALPKQQLKAIHEREKAQAKSEKTSKSINVPATPRPAKAKEPAKEVAPPKKKPRPLREENEVDEELMDKFFNLRDEEKKPKPDRLKIKKLNDEINVIQNKKKAEKALAEQEEKKAAKKKAEKPVVTKKAEAAPAKIIEKAKHQDITPAGLRKQKKHLVEALEDAINHPKKGKTILIKVPDDGQFQVRNNLDSLKKALGLVKKEYPIHPLKQAVIPEHKALPPTGDKSILEELRVKDEELKEAPKQTTSIDLKARIADKKQELKKLKSDQDEAEKALNHYKINVRSPKPEERKRLLNESVIARKKVSELESEIDELEDSLNKLEEKPKETDKVDPNKITYKSDDRVYQFDSKDDLNHFKKIEKEYKETDNDLARTRSLLKNNIKEFKKTWEVPFANRHLSNYHKLEKIVNDLDHKVKLLDNKLTELRSEFFELIKKHAAKT